MNRSDLVRAFIGRSGLDPTEADWFVRTFFEALSNGLIEDGRLELRGFGVFRVTERQQAGFQNPKNGRYYGGLPIRTIHFYASSLLDKEGL